MREWTPLDEVIKANLPRITTGVNDESILFIQEGGIQPRPVPLGLPLELKFCGRDVQILRTCGHEKRVQE